MNRSYIEVLIERLRNTFLSESPQIQDENLANNIHKTIRNSPDNPNDPLDRRPVNRTIMDSIERNKK